MFWLGNPDHFLVSLKVEHSSGCTPLNIHHFCARFVGLLSGPGDTLLFTERKWQAMGL
jgi:hypothetical protein